VPAPTRAALEAPCRQHFDRAKLKGEQAPDLAVALAETCAQVLALLVARACVLPGIAASAPPPAGVGATTGPGRLLPPPAGGPDASTIDPLARAQLASAGLRGERSAQLAAAIAGTLAAGVQLFTAQLSVAPGIPIAGLVTTAPGILIGSPPSASALEMAALGQCNANGILGEAATDLAKAIAGTLADSFGLLRSSALVAPGIAASPTMTVAPGRLL